MQSSYIDLPPAFNATGPDVERVSPKYKFYSTRELVQPLLDDHWEITTAFQVKPRVRDARFAKHLVRVTHPSLQLGADRLEMLIRNSHDGEQKLQIDLGAWRMVCSNGII